MKGQSLLLIVVNILLVAVIMLATGAFILTNGDFISFTRASSLSIEYKPNQKQTTFFGREEYIPVTETPTPAPTRSAQLPYQPIPTAAQNPPQQGQPIPTNQPNPNPASPFPTDDTPQGTPEPLPTPDGNFCPPDTINPNGCVCKSQGYGGDYESYMCNDTTAYSGKVVYFKRPGLNRYMRLKGPPWEFPDSITPDQFAQAVQDPSCARVCIEYDKPVLYLYPEEPTYVDVKLEVPGFVFKSIPEYPDEGWQDVLAYPNGTLIYKGKTYGDLFYETTVVENPSTRNEGILIARDTLYRDLDRLIVAYGLQGKERSDFLEYWVPRLQREGGSYYFTRILTWEEKNKVDLVHIDPKPDTFIHLLLEFKAVSRDYQFKRQSLPVKQPERKGFTVVEWGGRVIE